MQVKFSGSFAVPIYLNVLLVAIGFSFVVNAQAPAHDDSPAELNRRIVELYRQGKYPEAIPLVVALMLIFDVPVFRSSDPAESPRLILYIGS